MVSKTGKFITPSAEKVACRTDASLEGYGGTYLAMVELQMVGGILERHQTILSIWHFGCILCFAVIVLGLL